MSAWDPQTTKKGGLPHLSFILRKPEPLGMEFKVAASALLDMVLAIEIQEGRDAMRAKNPTHLGSTAACTHHLVDMTKSLDIDGNEERCLILGDSW